MSNTAAQILGALRSNIVALGNLESPVPNDPYVADAISFATQAGVCVEKHMLANGMEVPPDPNKPIVAEAPPMPSEEMQRDRDKAA